jgi:uncharacterized membrane protein
VVVVVVVVVLVVLVVMMMMITIAGHFDHRNGQMRRSSRWPCPKQGAVHRGEPPV